MANMIAGLGAQLSLDNTEFKKGIAEAKESLKELKEYLPEIISIAGFVELTKAGMEMSKQIVEVSKANEVAISSVLELSKALEENGGSAENAGQVYSGFTQKVETARLGSARAQESFARLGVTLDDLRHLSEQDLFEKTVTGLSKMSDASERNGLAFQTLGKSIRGVDLKGLQETLEETKGTMDKYAQSINDAHDLSLKLEAAQHSLKLEFTNAVIPTLNAFYDAMNNDGTIIKELIHWVGEFVKVATVMAKFTATTVRAVISDVGTLWEEAKLAMTGHFSEIGKLWQEQQAKTDAMVKSDFDYFDKLFNQQEDHAKKAKETQKTANNEVLASYQKQLDAANNIAKAYQAQAKEGLYVLESQLQISQETKNQKQLNEELLKVTVAKDKALTEVDKQIEAAKKIGQGHDIIIATLKKEKEQILDTYQTTLQETEKLVLEVQKYQESFAYGWDKAFKQFRDDAQNQADAGGQAFNTVVSSMDSALSNFVKTGKLNFSDLVGSIIKDLMYVQLKMQANDLFGSLFTSGKSMLSAFLAGPANGASGLGTGVTGFGSSYAEGGDPTPNTINLVGENGPELFIPKQAGTVIPNNKLSDAMGNGQTTNVTNNYINAIDTKSFEERILGSATAVWAANQYGAKSLATTTGRT